MAISSVYACVRLGIPIRYGVVGPVAVVVFLGVLGLAAVARRQAEARKKREEWTSLKIFY